MIIGALLAAGIALLAIVALLAIPVSAAFDLHWRERLNASVDLALFFGLIRTRLHTPGHPDGAAAEIVREPGGRESDAIQGFPRASVMLRQKALFKRFLSYLRKVWHAVQREDFRLHMRLGLGDPADTGWLWAVTGPVSGALAGASSGAVFLEPDFNAATFAVDGSGRIRFIPLQLIGLTLALGLSPIVWRGIRQLQRASQ